MSLIVYNAYSYYHQVQAQIKYCKAKYSVTLFPAHVYEYASGTVLNVAKRMQRRNNLKTKMRDKSSDK